MNIIQTARSIIRDNPELARVAITADITIGIATGVVTYIILNSADISAVFAVALGVNLFLFTAGVALMAYALIMTGVIATPLTRDRDDYSYQDIEFGPEDQED